MKKVLVIILLLLTMGTQAQNQSSFKTPEDAVAAFQKATGRDNDSGLRKIFGTLTEPLLKTDEERTEVRRLLHLLLEERWMLAPREAGGHILRLGLEGWPFPVPLVKGSKGWYFDTESGLEEIEIRRVGQNELLTIETCYRLVDAQEDYKLRDPNGDGVREYTSKFVSSPGQRDGLFWPIEDENEEEVEVEESPLQAALKEAWKYAEGRTEGAPWFGYRYLLLTSQGEGAPGGVYGYLINGHQIGGWAVVAYPADYGKSGVMTFLCNQNGVIYQKDRGEATPEPPTVFDVDDSWEMVERTE
jgi:Protein of unknown function (DUF2950)